MNNKLYITISEVSKLLNIDQHVIRYWDSRFEGVSTRLNEKKRRFFNTQNITKLEILKKLLHTNGKSHHSIETAKKILENYHIKKNINPFVNKSQQDIRINKLAKVSSKLKKIIELID